MKYFQKQTLRFEKLRGIKDFDERVTFSVMLLRSFFALEEGSGRKRTKHRAVFRPFSWVNDIKILIPYDQISRMKYKQ